ncbi:hypothetical protein PRK78_006093 [Emydomyces testavorans]|uniref:Mog1p/PsbP-like protein n=1 Tax=Emydomyces testavorans TaxID=2070801 RepID=A0AAF0DNG7_9EURO|nr:hypothetical protein PRK78_006093 [Emydomyces testavorans]
MVQAQTTTPGYIPTPLFGGAMTADIPEGFKDMSTVRPVPDNQEVFASSSTDTSIIIELLQRLERDSPAMRAAMSDIPGAQSSSSSSEVDDDALAVLAHIHDICRANNDRFELVDPPKLHPVRYIPEPTYTCEVKIFSPAVVRDASSGATRSYDRVATTCLFMVRLVLQDTDMLVHVNVPQTEFVRSGDLNALASEEMKAREALEQIMHTLKILDFGLFAKA